MCLVIKPTWPMAIYCQLMVDLSRELVLEIIVLQIKVRHKTMGKNKVKKNPGKKGKGKQVESSSQDGKEENSPFKLSEMVTAGAKVTVVAGKGADVMSNNNNTDFSKEGASKGEGCGTGKNKRESINWQRREGCKAELDNEERGSKEEEKEDTLKMEDSSEVNKLKDISNFSDSSGFQEMSSSLLEKQETQHVSSETSCAANSSLLENSNASFGPIDDLNQGFIDCSFEEKVEERGGGQRKVKKTKALQHQRSNQSYPTIEDFVKAGVPRRIAMMKHPLQNTWTFW